MSVSSKPSAKGSAAKSSGTKSPRTAARTPQTGTARKTAAALSTPRTHRSARATAPAEAERTTRRRRAVESDDAANVAVLDRADETPIDATAPIERPAADLDEVAASADLVRVYLNEIGKVALLTAADEVDLSKRIEAGLYAKHLLGTANDFARQGTTSSP